jgi:hypothetical protein
MEWLGRWWVGQDAVNTGKISASAWNRTENERKEERK